MKVTGSFDYRPRDYWPDIESEWTLAIHESLVKCSEITTSEIDEIGLSNFPHKRSKPTQDSKVEKDQVIEHQIDSNNIQ